MTSLMKKTRIFLACIGLTLALLIVAGCQPNSPQEDSSSSGGDEDIAAVEIAWTPDSDCVTCHTDSAASISDPEAQLSMHPESDCGTCHNDDGVLQTVHEGVTTADDANVNRLKDTEVIDENCMTCHSDTAALIEATKDSTALTDLNGMVANPHERIGHEDAVNCSSCHTMHSDATVEEEAKDTCISCHHAEVYECGTCHAH